MGLRRSKEREKVKVKLKRGLETAKFVILAAAATPFGICAGIFAGLAATALLVKSILGKVLRTAAFIKSIASKLSRKEKR